MDSLERIGLHWPALNRLLDCALELAPAERDRWIANLPAEDAALRSQLLALLESESPSSFLESLPPAGAPPASFETPEGTLGPWRLIRHIGEGGMAAVWLARRSDGMLSNPVAIKVPHPGWYGRLLSERMDREREILGRLNHPNIARLLDAGFSSAGQPYLALEYIEGRPIDDYCRDRALSLRGRIELFLQLAGAISYAHRLLVLHRDLKPSNILVTDNGGVRVLDFGIAKLLDDGRAHETELTRFAGRALTLDYASPEQIRGEPLAVASDVYSLGVVLYELLAGTRPYHLKRDSRAALEEAILEVDPPAPSRAAAGNAWRRAIRGDLDTIVLKALKKDPAQRYPTVDALADDLSRYLEHRPVLARPDRPVYRLAKFIRRNRAGVAAGIVMALSLGAGAGTALWQARAAKSEAVKAREAKDFLLSVFIDAHAYRQSGNPLSAVDLLKQAPSRMDRMRSVTPEVRVGLLNNIGASLLSLQDTAIAETVLNRAVSEAAPLGPDHLKTLRSRSLQAWVRLFRGRISDALAESTAVLDAMRRTPGALPADLTSCLRVRSAAALQLGDARAAERDARDALRIAEARLGTHHDQTVLSLAALCSSQVQEASPQARDTCEHARRRALAAYAGRRNHLNVLKSRAACAQALAVAGRRDEAMAEISEVIADASKQFGSSSRAVGLYLCDLARLQLESGRRKQARESIDRALWILSGHLDPGSQGHASLMELRARIYALRRVGPV